MDRVVCPVIARDGLGGLHVLAASVSDDTMRYFARQPGGTTWSSVNLQTSGNASLCSNDIAIDPSNRVHMVFRDSSVNPLAVDYVTDATGMLIRSRRFESASYQGFSLSVGAANEATLLAEHGGRLRLRTGARGAIASAIDLTPVNSVRVGAGRHGLVFDTNGRVHTGYIEATTRAPVHLTNRSGSWVSTPVDSSVTLSGVPRVGLDGLGRPHLLYFDTTSGRLKLSSNLNGTWMPVVFEARANVLPDTAMMVGDAQGRLHVVYELVGGPPQMIPTLVYARFDPATNVWARTTFMASLGAFPDAVVEGNTVHLVSSSPSTSIDRLTHRALACP